MITTTTRSSISVNPRRHQLACPVQACERVMRPTFLRKTFLVGTPKRHTKYSYCLFPSLCSYLQLAWTRVTALSRRVARRLQQYFHAERQTAVASIGEQVYSPFARFGQTGGRRRETLGFVGLSPGLQAALWRHAGEPLQPGAVQRERIDRVAARLPEDRAGPGWPPTPRR
jgi:hypothetical protein